MKPIKVSDIRKEVKITTARSGGPGGQHVNKVETKVMLRWNIGDSDVLSDLQKELVRASNTCHITKEDEILISVDSKRS